MASWLLIRAPFRATPDGGSVHATTMLLPALAVYLLGPRLSLLMTGLMVLALMVLHPIYFAHLGVADTPPPAWNSHLFGAFAFLGAWWLGSLNSTARDAAQGSLERTLKVLRESEGKLSSVIESTDDVVISLDTEARVLTANSAAQHLYEKRLGTRLELGKKLIPEQGSERSRVWKERLAQVLRGERPRFEEDYLLGDRRLVLDINVSPILGEDGRPVGMTIFGRDITARKEAEARLGEMHRTLVDASRQAAWRRSPRACSTTWATRSTA
jgi:PAS domain S-box-containing protein